MSRTNNNPLPAYTLIEVVLVVGLMVTLSALVVPNFMNEIRRDVLPRSARQLRSLVAMVRANAALDGKRYRIRFPGEDEEESLADARQPLIEREDDPLYEPEVFNLVTAPWAMQGPLLERVWCAEVRLERPSIERLQELRNRSGEQIEDNLLDEELLDELEPERPPVFVHPDGTSEWVTFVLTTAPPETSIDELEDFESIHLIVDGPMGIAWIQRPFYEEELDLFEERGWPAVLRQDFLDPRVLTEDDVLEIRESSLRGHRVKKKGNKLEQEP